MRWASSPVETICTANCSCSSRWCRKSARGASSSATRMRIGSHEVPDKFGRGRSSVRRGGEGCQSWKKDCCGNSTTTKWYGAEGARSGFDGIKDDDVHAAIAGAIFVAVVEHHGMVFGEAGGG